MRYEGSTMNDSSEAEWHEFPWDQAPEKPPGPHKKLKLYVDENVPIQLVDLLKKEGIPIVTAMENGKTSHPDQSIYQRARKTGRVLLTMDRDFWNDHKHPLEKGSGIIYMNVSPWILPHTPE